MKKTRRWLALLLAVILVGSNALYQIGTSMSASETETTAESEQQDDSAAVPETQDQDTASLDQQKDTGGVQVQEVTPQTQQEKTNSQSEAAKTQQVQPAQNNTSVSDQNTQAVSGAEPAQETPEEKTYHVTIQKSDVDGGTIKAWGSDGNKADVTYNSENKYVKEVKEGEEFNFEITAKDTYKVAKVTDQNGTTVEPKAVNNNVYTYEVKNITAEGTYSITYVKEEVKKAESTSNGDQQKSDDEQSEDADDDGEPAAKVQAAAEEVMTDFYVGADRTSVTVGDTVNVKAIIKPDNYSNKKVTWESSDDDTATVDENGVVTTLQTGIVTITGTSEANAEYTDSVVIQINPVSVTGITINGYNKDYLTKNESVQLTAVAEPQNAEDKELTWSSSNKNVATVDQTGNVTAKGQGTAVIRVENTASGKYATQEVTVYEKEPQSVTVHVWVTNQDEGKTYIFYLPKDGTVVNASSVHKSVEGYVTTGDIRVGSWTSAGSSWTNIKKVTTAKRFRYNNGNIQYSTSDSGNEWKNVGAKSIVDFCESVRKGDSSSDTDVKVILGDWPYNDGVNPAHNRQTIRIEVVAKDDADNTTVVYNSGTMRYDNASNGEYGKIKFNCDESRYEVEKVLVYKNDEGTGNADKTYSTIPTGGINVSFKKDKTNHYLVQAIVKPKKFNVVYDANGGKNVPDSETLTAVNGQKVTVATTPQPTKTDYIFAGWEYNGTTYYGGESFEMPPSNVTFVAKWIPASTAISYKSNNTDWGTVSRSHEIVKDGATAKGSVANAKEGYEFVEWQDADGKQVSTDNFYRPDEKAGSYTAIFQAKTYNVTYQFTGAVPDGAKLPETGKHKFDSEVKVAEVADVPGYTFEGWTSQDVTLKNGTFTMPAKNVTLTGTWKQKEGKFGYYLSLAAATWKGGMPANLEENGRSEQGLPKYAEKVHYSYGDKYNVISNVPTAEGYAFIGWLDKERGNQSAAIRKAGDELTYIYESGKDNKNRAYTLDALWASIAAEGGTYTYTGSSHQIKADIAINEGLNLDEKYVNQAKKFIKTGKMKYSTDNETWSEENPSFTDAGTYTVYVRQNVTVGGTTTTLQSSAQIVINPRNVELTSATASRMYNGKALTKKEVTVSGDGFITGEGATYNVTGSQKVVGSSENTFAYTLTKATKAKNYNIKKNYGTLTVTNRDAKYEITVKANSTTGTYNGTEYSAIGLESTTFTVDGNVYTVEGLTTEDPVKKDSGTYTNNVTGTAVVKDADGNDVTDQFLVKTSNGSLKIKKAEVTLKSADLSKEYDGDALVNGNTALEIESGWAAGEGADYAFTGSQTLVGSSENTFTYTAREGTNFNNYTIKPSNGTLTVTNRDAKYEITVKANSTKATYDGKKHKAEGVETYEFTINNHKYTVSGLKTEDPEHKNAGTYTNNITGTAVVTDEAGNDVSSEFLVKTEDGSLKINKAKVTLKSADLNKKYDGKALVNGDKALATETGWAEGEGADYTFTGSQTLVGSSANSFTYKAKAGTNFNNYEITANSGTLTVTSRDAKYEITVKANSTTGTYNGTEYSAIGLESTTFTVDGNVYTVEGLTTENPKQKNAGTYTNNITGTAIVKDAAGNDVSSEFAVSTENGSLKIKKAEVTLKSATLTKQYDGDALVNGDKALAIETGWAEGEGADYHFTGSQTLVGSSENTFTYTAREGTNFNNYTIKPSNGTLTVTNRDAKYEITVKANSTKATYDGKKHKAEGVETYEFTINNHKYTVSGLKTEDPEHKNAGTYTNNITGTAVVTDEAGNDVSSEFLVKTEDGSLKINKAKVTLKSADLNKKYDGKALVNGDKALAIETGWAEGEGADYTFTGSQTLVGSSANSFTYKAKAGTNFNNYEITANSGTLTVTSRDAKYEITVKANSTTGTYNGTEYSAIGLESTTFTVDGNVYTVEGLTTENPKQKNAGTYTNNITGTAIVKDAAGNDVSSEFAVSTENGSLKIKKAEVTLKSATLTKQYDGDALVNGDKALAIETGWAEGEGADYHFTGSQTLVGSSENTFTYTAREGTNFNNYTIKPSNGTLTVTNRDAKYEITVKANSTKATYDGKKHKAEGVETYEFTINNHKYTVSGLKTEDPEHKNAGTYTNNITGTAVVTDEAGNDVSSEFLVKTEDGSLKINKAKVTLKSADLNKKYDGKALVNGDKALATETGWAEGEGADYTFTGSQTLVGSSANSFTYKAKAGTNFNNYEITANSGTLTVTSRDAKYEITVKANSTTGTYNGTEYSAIGLESTTFTVDGNVYTVEGLTTENPKQKNAGTYTNNITGTAIVKDAAGNDVSSEFAVSTENGSLKIKKAEVTLKSATLTKQYDGDALVNGDKALAIETGWAEGEGADYHFTGSQTLVGSSENTFTYTAREGTNFNNYTIKPSNGTLTVTNRDAKYEITVKANSTKATYDGKKHKAEGVETYEFTINNHKYTVSGLKTEDPEHKNAGTYTNNITGTAVVTDEAGNDVSSEFLVKTEDGSLKINKAKVTLKSADLNKKYDGKALVNGDKALATETGWAEGEGADYTFTGSQTLVGSSANSFTYKAKAGTNFNNYEITANSGTLTVTSRDAKYEITVKANSTTGTYNGTEYSAIGLESTTFTVDGNVYTVEGLTTENPKQKNAGTYTNNITGTAIVKDAAGNDVSSEFAVSTENGSLKIKKAEVTLKSANLNKVYDGKALVNGTTALATETGWAESDKAAVVYEFTGSQTEVGSSENKFAVKWNDTVKESNYNVSIEFGTLTVTEQSIVPGPDPENPVPNYKGIKIDDPSDVPYDGKEHKWTPTVTDAKDNRLTEGTDYEVSYNKKDYTNVTGAIKVTITGKGNYTGSVIKSYQITPASVSIKTNGAERVYNGKPLTAAGTIEGLVNNETVDFKVTGSQTEVGNSKNTYTLKWTGTAKESNYQIVSEEIGTLVVTENAEELVVTTTGGTFTYTGLAHGATVTVSELPEGYTLETAESSATATDVTDASGVAATADRLVIRNAAGEDVTAKLNIKKVDGTIVVTPAALTITTPDANKVYDGNALTAAGTISGFVNGETATFATTGSQTEVGNSKNAYTLTWDGTAKETNYTVSDSVGTLKVTEQSIIPGPDPENPVPNYKGIKIDDPSDVPYDGKEHKWTPTVTDAKDNKLTEGTDYEVSYNKKDYTNVTGAIEVTITGKGNYTGSVTKSYQITPASVSIKTNGAERVYNGKPLTADGKIEGLVNNETVDFKVTGSQTEVGNSKNTYTLKWTGTAKKSNYQIVSKEIGTLVVTENAKEIVVTTTGGTFTYTGHAHGATVTVSKLPEGYTLETAESSATATDVTKLPVKATADKLVIRNAQGKDVTDKLKITKIDGTIKVTPAALTITTPRAEKVYDGNALTAEGSITGFVNGETATFITTGSQTEVGNSKNTYTLTWDGTAKETNYTVSDSVGTLEVTKQSIVPDPNNPESYKDVTIDDPSDATYDGKEHKWSPVVTDKDGNELKEGTDYEVSYSKDDFTNVTGEIKVTITGKGNYTGTVDKTYQITPKAVIITTDSDTRAFNDQPLTAPGRVDGIVAGETYGFTVTGTQTYVGSSANSYQMTWAKKGENKYTAKKSNYKVEENIGTLTVTDGTPENPVTPSLVVNKTHDTDKTYKAGDVITFTITVKNIYDEAKTITLEEQEGVTLDKTTFENVKPGKEITASAAYTVTEADIVNGTFTNNVKATFSGVDKEYTGTDTVDKFEESRPHMTITKVTKDAGKNHIYKLGETINYVITVENDGNLTLTNVKIEDALTGNAGENAWMIDTFAPGEKQTFETSYVVTEADVIAGKVVNNATGEAENPDPKKEETPVTPGEKEDPVETPNPGLTVVKTSDAEGQVTLGQKITYTITVTNNGNVTISGVKLDDSLTGDNWTLGNIKPGETVTKKTTYTVTEKDIIAGKVENHATATGKDPSGNEIKDEGEKTVTTEESNPQITVTKETTSTPKNGKTYALGEKITYKITAKNTGNLTLTDVTVSDKLTGNTGDKAFKIDGKFKPGEEATFEASYTVKESDLGKTVVNEATAAGKTTDPKNPEPGVTPGTTEDPVDQKNPAMTITKKVTDKKEEYQIGDTVEYEITVKNTGNTTQNNVLVEDRMNAAGSAVITKVEGAKGTIDGANVTLDTLAPGKEATIKAEYTVVKEDRGNTITNAAVAKGEGETPVTPEVPVDVEDVYDIHVTHVFADGEESSAALPEDYDIENLKPGTTKLLNAEEVSGYTAYPAAERVTIEEEDVTVTFVYYKDAIGTDPANPDQPDNIPDRYQAVVKFEAVNGTVNIDHAVVTLFDENNEPAENGVGHLSLLQIANATADAGYDQSSLSWTPANPTIRYEITGEMTFTASFTATPATPGTTPANPTNPTPATPSTPANPAPSTPSTPANQTPARSTNIITRAAEAIADGAERIASDVREVLNNDDEDVPLAKQKLDDHKCCILHFLIMLLAAILYGFYTHNMKKRQKKMFEAREELDLELARRGLPTTKEQEQM